MRRRLTVLTVVLGGAVLTAGVAIALASTGTAPGSSFATGTFPSRKVTGNSSSRASPNERSASSSPRRSPRPLPSSTVTASLTAQANRAKANGSDGCGASATAGT